MTNIDMEIAKEDNGTEYAIPVWTDYVELAMRTAPDQSARAHLAQGAMTVIGELGELHSEISKVRFGDEAGDVYWGLALCTVGLEVLRGTTPVPDFERPASFCDGAIGQRLFINASAMVEMAEDVYFQGEDLNKRGFLDAFHVVSRRLTEACWCRGISPSQVLIDNIEKLEHRHLSD